jgi:excisionase family DNA binding protein
MSNRRPGKLIDQVSGTRGPKARTAIVPTDRAVGASSAADLEVLLELVEVAERLNCSVGTVRRRISAGELLAVKHGRALRVLGSDLQNFIRASASGGDSFEKTALSVADSVPRVQPLMAARTYSGV